MNDLRDSTDRFRSGPDECAYLRRRVAYHRQLAEKSGEAGTRSIHLRLAQLYGDRLRLLNLVLPDHPAAQRY